jgi:hypothetical protein
MLNVRLVESPAAIRLEANVMLTAGGATTAIAAEAAPLLVPMRVLPLAKLAVTLDVALFLVPALDPVTFTETVQLAAGGRFKAEIVMLPVPGVATAAAPLVVTQAPAKPLGLAISKPPGSGSVNPMFTNVALLLVFVKVKASGVVPFKGMLVAPNAIVAEGAAGSVALVSEKAALAVTAAAVTA